jgi:glycine betaine/proline transport system permease protein
MPRIKIGSGVESAINWLLDHFGWLFDAIASVTSNLVDWVEGAFTGLPTLVVIAIFTIWAFLASGWALALFSALAFLLIDSRELWTQTMQTLAVVLVAAVIATVIGVPVGIWAARRRIVGTIARPILDFMQTLPRLRQT